MSVDLWPARPWSFYFARLMSGGRHGHLIYVPDEPFSMVMMKHHYWFIFLFMLVSMYSYGIPRPLGAADPSPQTAEEYATQGAMLLSQGQWDEAIASFTRAIGLDPKHIDAHANLGMAYYFKGKVEAAIPEFQTALRLAPTRIDAAHGLGLALYEKGDIDAAIQAFRAAAQVNPMSNYNLGNVLEQKGDKAGALEAYKRYLAASPSAPDSRALGEAVQQGKFPTPAGGTAQAHFRRAQSALEKRDAQVAISEFLASLRLKPNQPEACNGLGLAFRTAGDLDQAIGTYRMALQFDNKFSPALRNLGQALEEQGNAAEAAAMYDRYLLLVPNAAEARQIREKIAQLRSQAQ
jgi:tetratricopeptide (TPR) repeat protein